MTKQINSSYPKIPSSEITPEEVYYSRRQFMKSVVGAGAGALALAACAPLIKPGSTESPTLTPSSTENTLTSYDFVTHFNNYYEFSMDKSGVAKAAESFITDPWSVEFSGLVRHPQKWDLPELIRQFPPEERVYRFRCVEAWAMVIPWNGIPLKNILKAIEPTSDARYVRFTTLYDPKKMPGQASGSYPYPYTEGLRLDEAENDLTLLATGLYGKPLLPQNGAPVRLVVPWKYGFKSIKSIVKIELTDQQPATFWNSLVPDEYGFYANVNPRVPHPRWPQSRETVIGTDNLQNTLLFNGYASEVAALYTGMDLQENY
jgi:sulfoxide reductase catalytic subunit YedY